MRKHWLPVLLCVIALTAGFDALNRIALLLTTLDIPDHLSTQTVIVSSIETKLECGGTGKSRLCGYQTYLVSNSGQSYRVFMKPLFEKGLDRLYRVPEGSKLSMSLAGNTMYAFEVVSNDNGTTGTARLSLSEFNQWRSDSLFSAASFLIFDGLIIILFWRRVASMSLSEAKALVKFTLTALAATIVFLIFPRNDLPRPEELHKQEITFSHVSREPDCPVAWPTHPRLTCDYTPYLVSELGERWTFGPGYKPAEAFVSIPPPGTTLYMETYRNAVYRIQRPLLSANHGPEKRTRDCDTKLVPVEDEGLIHLACKGERYFRPANHLRENSAFYQIAARNLDTRNEALKDRRMTLMSYDTIEQFHQRRQQSRNYLAGTLLKYALFTAVATVLIRTFWLRKRKTP